MALPAVYLKNHGVVQNSVGQMFSSPIAPWWSSVRPESAYGQFPGQSIGFSLDYLRKEENHNATEETGRIIKIRDFEAPKDGKKSRVDISFQSSPPEDGARPAMGPRKEMHPHLDRHHPDCCFGYFSAFGPQISGRVLLPFSLATDDGPTYVNAKQYHGILRRRISRAKAMKGRRPARTRKPYMHESRHLHAMRRPRGCGGRFLKKVTTKTAKADDSTRSESPASQNSEVSQADYTVSSKRSGSDATNMFSRENLSNLPINHRVFDLGHGLFVPAKWGII